ncbi:MAG: hypothetical protein H7328_05570 [Bdellovibrio sp.]|nr:hypothetical protein [Bdellovibrio sp.]
MKKFALMILITFGFGQTFAQNLQMPDTLKATMKIMGDDMKKLIAQSNKAELNSESTATAEELVRLIENAKRFNPEVGDKAEYLKAMEKTKALATQLVDAFKENKNNQATDILKALSGSKREGHSNFKD